jgi:hypothetical protein
MSRGDVKKDDIAPALALDKMVNERGSSPDVISFAVDVISS